uniref:Zinc-ribbon domain-containing protein n=1 Tax=Dictyoglomus turgidum TaxID=513050 RepID=A0A7C3WW89_9BACT
MTFVIFISLLCSILCYFLARKKERNKIVALFAGFLFGIFAIIYYLIVGKPKKICPYCGMKIPKEAKICPYCHREFDLIQK